jgi:flagellar assembly factor FliW
MPQGLLGFEEIKQYTLKANPGEEPFLWMRAQAKGVNLAFIVISPYEVVSDYHPDIPNEEARILGIAQPEDAWVLNVVTLRGRGRATVNLKGPIIINRHTMMAKQVVIINATDYALDHPLPLAAE